MTKELTIEGFDKINGMVVAGGWRVDPVATLSDDDTYYIFTLSDCDSNWNYPFIECKLYREQNEFNGYQLLMQLYVNPSNQSSRDIIAILDIRELSSISDFKIAIGALMISHFNKNK